MSGSAANMSLLARSRRRANAVLGRYRKTDDGATVIEFAVLAVPFFMLLFAILELAVLFYLNSALDNAASAASRNVRVGQLQGTYTTADEQLTEFRATVCEKMKAFPSCQKNLRITMKISATNDFNEAMTNPSTDNELDCSGPRDVVILRVRYTYNLILPGNLTQLQNSSDGSNTHVLSSTTAFRNEPFSSSAGTACGTASSDNTTV